MGDQDQKSVEDVESECQSHENLLPLQSQSSQNSQSSYLGKRVWCDSRACTKKCFKGGGTPSYFSPLLETEAILDKINCLLNACPFHGRWFKCYNYLIAPCGHTYQPWCIQEHCRTSTNCFVDHCQITFYSEWYQAWGIRHEPPIAGLTQEGGSYLKQAISN